MTTKILVNWTTQKVIHCFDHRGSKEFRALQEKGYTEVGTIKTHDEPNTKFFWEPDHFDPAAKYGSKQDG